MSRRFYREERMPIITSAGPAKMPPLSRSDRWLVSIEDLHFVAHDGGAYSGMSWTTGLRIGW